jgi:hypothetical protein
MTTSIIRGLLILTLSAVGAFGLPLSAHAKSGDPAGTASHGQIQPTKTWLMQMIVQEAGKTDNVTPSVALAVAKIESGFRPHVVSSAGAIGVMQIMPKTGRDVFRLSRTELFDPAINIRAGVTFLDQLITQYDGRIDLALSHYNGGSRVTAGPTPKIIPATRGYVIKVLAAAQAYEAGWADIPGEQPDAGPLQVAEQSLPTPKRYAAGGHATPAKSTDKTAGTTAQTTAHTTAHTTAWQQHLKEADIWVAAAQATLAANPPAYPSMTGRHGSAEKLVMNLWDNRRAFRHWLKANQ